MLNRHGGRENLEAIEFLRRMNHLVGNRSAREDDPRVEESFPWPMASAPADAGGGLGFHSRRNMAG